MRDMASLDFAAFCARARSRDWTSAVSRGCGDGVKGSELPLVRPGPPKWVCRWILRYWWRIFPPKEPEVLIDRRDVFPDGDDLYGGDGY